MHESWIVYRELVQVVFWKFSEGFQANAPGHFCRREPEILLKRRPYHRCFLSSEIFENG